MTETTIVNDSHAHSGRLARTRFATRAAITVERLWPLLLPVLLVVAMFVSLSWLGLFRLMPETLRLAFAVAFGIVALAALYALRFFRRPTVVEIDRRIERANRLEHNPVSVQSDRPSGQNGVFADALWREHQKRMAERLAAVSGDLPHTRVPERDPWALRAAVALLFVIAFAFSYGPLGGSVADAFRPQSAIDAIPPRIDAWVTPPAYTGKAPIFLTSDANQATPVFTVPEGSDVALRVTGGSGEETLSFSDASGNVRDIAANAPADPTKPVATGMQSLPRQFSGKLTADGTLSLKSGNADVHQWAFAVIPDKPPVISFSSEPKRAVNGTLELNYTIEDDYGAASADDRVRAGRATAQRTRTRSIPPLKCRLSLPRRGANGSAAKSTRDLTEHVWAGAASQADAEGDDDAGHEARSETKTIMLPERPFSNPLARAVIEQRRILALDANRKRRVLDLMDAITLRPEDTFDNMSHYLVLMSARSRLKMAENDDALRDVVSYLWQIALGIEDGDLSAAEKRLRQAQQALKEALERGASDEEIDKLMKELRTAMNEFLREFAERAQKNPNLAEQMQPGQELRQSDIDRLMDQIENLAKSGNREQAQELLSQLENMMNNLQAGRQQQRGQNGQQGEMRKQMDKLGEIMRRQQEMMNETFRMDQMQRGQRQRGQNRDEQLGEQNGEGQPDGEQGKDGQGKDGQGMTPEEFADALKQLARGSGPVAQRPARLDEGPGRPGHPARRRLWRGRRGDGRGRRPRSARARAMRPSASRAARWKRCARARRT